MDKSNLELFKQAISEGLSEKLDSVANSCTDEIVCSDRHKLAMRMIVYGKAGTKRALSPKMKRLIAILVAAALILTSCGIIFRNQIREVFKEFFVSLTYDADEGSNKSIQEIYVLGYVPDGYALEKERITSVRVRYEYTNEIGETLFFEQRAITHSDLIVDSENGYSKMIEIEEYEIYYRYSGEYNYYVFTDNKYCMKLRSTIQLSNDEIVRIIDGIKTK